MKPQMIPNFVVAFILLLAISGCGGSGAQQLTHTSQDPPTTTSTTASPAKVSISPGFITLGASETQQFTASVINSSTTAVTWSLQCDVADCGTISATGLYTAPAVISCAAYVYVLATAQADTSIRNSAIVDYMPLAVELSPSEVNMAAGQTQTFTASLTRHLTHDVTWGLTGLGCRGDACGTLTNTNAVSATYTAPAAIANTSTALVTATSVADPTKSQTIRISLMPVTATLDGRYAFLFRASDNTTVFAGSLVADSNGTLSGIGDLINGDGMHANQPFTGTYTLGSDGRGTMQITGAGATLKFAFAMESGNFGRLIEFSGAGDGNGWLEKQNESAFSSAAIAGKYAYLLAGKRTEGSVSHVGWVAFDSSCKIVGNYSTMNDPAVRGHYIGGGSFGWGTIDAGYCTIDENTGRGTLIGTDRWLDTLPDIFFYVVDANRAVLLGDANPGSLRLSGTMERMTRTQYEAADFRGDYSYYVISDDAIAAGRMSAGAGPDGATTALSEGIEDRVADSKATLDTPVTGAISNSWCYPNCWYGNSDFVMTLTTASVPLTESYLAPVSPTKLYFIGDGYYGQAYAQSGGPFSSNLFGGDFGLQLYGRDAHLVGMMTMASSLFSGQADLSNNTLTPGASTDGTISFVSGDRANVSVSTSATGSLPFRAYVLSPKKLLLLSTMPGQVTMGWLEKEQ